MAERRPLVVIAGRRVALPTGDTLPEDPTLLKEADIGSLVCAQGDARLSDSREWTAATVTQAEAEAGTATTRRAWTAQRVFQSMVAWWNASAAKTKLDGIASGATANATDAQLRDRSTHTGTQAHTTVTGLGGAATLNVGTAAGTVCAGNDARLSDARTPTSHTHGNLTNAGAIGSTANLPVITTTSGVLTTGSFGTTANTFCQGNDARLSDARTPTAHTHIAANISDSTTAGRAILTAADAAAQRTALDLVKQTSATDVTPGRLALVDYVQLRTPVNDIGAAGGVGFGVGLYPGNPSVLGLSPLPGCDQLGHDNYGNYVHANGSIVCWVPAFWLRIGSASSPRYATYGANAHDCLPESAFADESAANAAGYMLHRALRDGGQLKRGAFVDKYLASPDATGQLAVSAKNGTPISLTTTSTYTRSQTMPDCVGQLHDAITLSRARGPGWNATSIFIYDLLARLAMCHAQAASSATHCAWYDAAGAVNFPKGCNNNALRDINDANVLYVTAGDAGAAAKGRTGSATPFAKTTHNGQPCGIADLNGLLWEVALGLTAPGSSATDSAQRADGLAWVLKDSVALASLTAGWNGATDAWQSAATIETLYDYYADFLPWGSAIDWQRFGNGTEQVFSGALSGSEYLRTCCGVPTATGLSASGTNLFGQDGNYRYNCANLFPRVGASWIDGSYAGVFARGWNNRRSNALNFVGFRASCYGL